MTTWLQASKNEKNESQTAPLISILLFADTIYAPLTPTAAYGTGSGAKCKRHPHQRIQYNSKQQQKHLAQWHHWAASACPLGRRVQDVKLLRYRNIAGNSQKFLHCARAPTQAAAALIFKWKRRYAGVFTMDNLNVPYAQSFSLEQNWTIPSLVDERVTFMSDKIIERCEAMGLRMTEQRRIIADVLEDSKDHPDVEALYERASEKDNRISLATVYRTVKLFEEAGILDRLEFGDGRSRYEDAERDHHDHLIDLTSGTVIEFVDPEIEALQEKIAQKLGYTLKGHKLELYGVPLKK